MRVPISSPRGNTFGGNRYRGGLGGCLSACVSPAGLAGERVVSCWLAHGQMTFKIPLLHQARNDLGQSGDSDFGDDHLAKLIVIGLARLQSRLDVLGETDGIDEHDWVTPTAFAGEE